MEATFSEKHQTHRLKVGDRVIFSKTPCGSWARPGETYEVEYCDGSYVYPNSYVLDHSGAEPTWMDIGPSILLVNPGEHENTDHDCAEVEEHTDRKHKDRS